MDQITLKIDGMMCAMCESHINEAIRKAMPVKKVSSSHRKGETVVIAENLDEAALKAAVDQTGYRVLSMTREPYEKKGLFARLKA